MILNIEKNPKLDNDYINLKYRQLSPIIEQILDICNINTQIIMCEKDQKKYNIDINDIYYIEWVDNCSCIYTEKDTFTISQTLIKLEQQLDSIIFIRVSKSMLINIYKIKAISSSFNMKLSAELINNEIVNISRHYRHNLLNAIYDMGRKEKNDK